MHIYKYDGTFSKIFFTFVDRLHIRLDKCKSKGEGKVVPVLSFFTEHHTMNAYWGW